MRLGRGQRLYGASGRWRNSNRRGDAEPSPGLELRSLEEFDEARTAGEPPARTLLAVAALGRHGDGLGPSGFLHRHVVLLISHMLAETDDVYGTT